MIGCVVTGMEESRQGVMKTIDVKRHEKLLNKAVSQTVKLMREYCPVDTGTMMQSIIDLKIGELQYAILVDVPYAMFNEYGTYSMPVGSVDHPLGVTSGSGKRAYRPFMRPAIWRTMKDMPTIVKQALFFK